MIGGSVEGVNIAVHSGATAIRDAGDNMASVLCHGTRIAAIHH
jgi:hypothetical protein